MSGGGACQLDGLAGIGAKPPIRDVRDLAKKGLGLVERPHFGIRAHDRPMLQDATVVAGAIRDHFVEHDYVLVHPGLPVGC